MPDLTPERLAELRALTENATPGPWFYNGYSGVFSHPLGQVYDDLEFPGCEVPKHKESCGDGPCPGCPFFEHEHEHGPLVAHVPAHHGDTAIGRHAADAAFIAEARSLIPALLDEIERLRADLLDLLIVAGRSVSDATADDPGVRRLMRYMSEHHPIDDVIDHLAAAVEKPTTVVSSGDMAVELPGIEPDKVVDLMEALERSIGEAKAARRGHPQPRSER